MIILRKRNNIINIKTARSMQSPKTGLILYGTKNSTTMAYHKKLIKPIIILLLVLAIPLVFILRRADRRTSEDAARPEHSRPRAANASNLGYELSHNADQVPEDYLCPICREEQAFKTHGTCTCKRCKKAICQSCLGGILDTGRTLRCPLCRHRW